MEQQLKSELLETEKKKRKINKQTKNNNVTNQNDDPPPLEEKKKRQTKNVVNANLVEQLTDAIRDVLTKVPQF